MSVSTQSRVDNIAEQRNQRKVPGTSESFFRQEKRFRADQIAMRGDDRWNP